MTATLWPQSRPTLAASLLDQFTHRIAPEDEQRSAENFRAWLPEASPEFDWTPAHLGMIQDAVGRVTSGTTRKLMLFLPPRHSKSETVTVRYSAYRLEQNPLLRVIVAAYNHTLAASFSRRIRRITRDRGLVQLSRERNTADQWETEQGGGVRAVGVGGGVTGMGGDLIVIDDPVKSRAEADSAVFRDKVWDWYTDDLLTRREPGAAMILIMTRWHRDDLAGRILASDDGPNWEVVHLPALALDDDPLERKPGAALWPARFDEEELAAIRVAQGERGFWALYQGQPQADGGAVFLADWWHRRNRYDPEVDYHDTVARLIYWDTAEEDDTSAAYTVGVVAELTTAYRLRIVEVVRKRVEFPALLALIESTATRHNHDGKLRVVDIEYASSGRQAYQSLRMQADEWLARLMRRSIPRLSKVARAHAAASWCAVGMVELPEPGPLVPWLNDYERELFDFPTGAFADQVDATSGAINRVKRELEHGFRRRAKKEQEAA